MNIPLLQGRLLEESDLIAPTRVAVIDETLARQYWPEGNAIGQRFSTDHYDLFERTLFGDMGARFVDATACTIVGIVGNVKQSDLAESGRRGIVYLPYTDSPKFHLLLRTSAAASFMAPTVERLVRQLDPDLPLTDFQSMQTRIDDSLVPRRSPALLTVVFAGLALLLAGLGTYGVLAHAVSQRRSEVGVRMALGATRQQIGRQFLTLGFNLLWLGVALGSLGAWAAGRAMQSLLVEVPSLHLSTGAGTVLVMSLVTLLAVLLPARRAARVEPMEALRHE
jgi:ABC-type antimicrobial peptide transport system permease subunit